MEKLNTYLKELADKANEMDNINVISYGAVHVTQISTKVNKEMLCKTFTAPREGKKSPTHIQVYLDSYAGKISRAPTLQTNNSVAQAFI